MYCDVIRDWLLTMSIQLDTDNLYHFDACKMFIVQSAQPLSFGCLTERLGSIVQLATQHAFCSLEKDASPRTFMEVKQSKKCVLSFNNGA